MGHDGVRAGRQSRGEEIANSLTHGVGAVLAVAGLVVLALCASRYGTTRTVVGCVVFGSALVLLYASSTLYHSVGHGHARAKAVLRVLDHSAIFLLIAGTYTPFTLVSLWGPWGWCALRRRLGPRARRDHPPPRAAPPADRALRRALPRDGVVRGGGGEAPPRRRGRPAASPSSWPGGLAYSVGVVFYASRRPYHHAIWHGFVLAGSAFHYVAVLRYVALA